MWRNQWQLEPCWWKSWTVAFRVGPGHVWACWTISGIQWQKERKHHKSKFLGMNYTFQKLRKPCREKMLKVTCKNKKKGLGQQKISPTHKTYVLFVYKMIYHTPYLLILIYSDPSILRPPMGPRKCGLRLQVFLKWRSFHTEVALWDQSNSLIMKGGLKIDGCKIEGLLYIVTSLERALPWQTTSCKEPSIPGRMSRISVQLNLSPKITCLDMWYFYGQWGGLSRKVKFYCKNNGEAKLGKMPF